MKKLFGFTLLLTLFSYAHISFCPHPKDYTESRKKDHYDKERKMKQLREQQRKQERRNRQ